MKLNTEITNKQVISSFNSLESRCRAVHGDKYDYSKVVFSKMVEKVIITCPVHGDFGQALTRHINNASGCKSCGYGKSPGKKRTLQEFMENAKVVHSDMYTYDKVTYVNGTEKVLITCPQHGDFLQKPSNHLSGNGCPGCGKIKYLAKTQLTRDKAIERIKLHSPTSWDFRKFSYSSAHKHCTVTCKEHGDYEVVVNNLFNGRGCPQCASSGFKYRNPAILYYVRVGNLYKIGITNNSVHTRFTRQEKHNMTVLAILHFETGKSCHKVEQAILQANKSYLYEGKRVLKSGNTELFTKDILPGFRNQ